MSKHKDANKTKVALVMGSGGARGLAHIGAIQVIEQHGFDIQCIAGTSMGALIGGIHAMGQLDVYAEWVQTLSQTDVFRLLDWNLSGGGLVKGNSIINKLKELVGHCDIESLPMSYTAVAVDINRGREVWLDRGPLFDAIRASIAIPGIFTPYSYQGMTLIDGGILNPLPVTPILNSYTDLTIAVDVNAGLRAPQVTHHQSKDKEESSDTSSWMGTIQKFLGNGNEEQARQISFTEVVTGALDIMQSALTRYTLATHQPDIYIRVPHGIAAIHEFHRASELIETGRQQAQEAIDQYYRDQ